MHTAIVFDPESENFYYKQVGIYLRKNDHNPTTIKKESILDVDVAARSKIFKDFKLDCPSILKLAIIQDT